MNYFYLNDKIENQIQVAVDQLLLQEGITNKTIPMFWYETDLIEDEVIEKIKDAYISSYQEIDFTDFFRQEFLKEYRNVIEDDKSMLVGDLASTIDNQLFTLQEQYGFNITMVKQYILHEYAFQENLDQWFEAVSLDVDHLIQDESIEL